ncbi:undecaprenyldiphospho-muramoylpentapeptide beta-N-acetylglucosaminyltransferase, partial [Thermodesulfobacteriota bacterium]
MRLLIAGGGTGGHLFPAIAIARAFMDADSNNEVLFVGTKRGLEKRVLAKEGFKFKPIKVRSLAGRSIVGKLISAITIPFSMLAASFVVRRFKPDYALGVGGYVSGPVILIASFMGVSSGVQEQNIYPGITNKILGKYVDTIFLAFKEATMFFEDKKVCVTGNPVRHSLLKVETKAAYEAFSFDENKFTVLVFGGSLGAESINKAFIDNLELIAEKKDEIQVIHQTGEHGVEEIAVAYAKNDVKAFVAPFIYNMHDAYEVADVIFCRAGATTISELSALSKAAVLVPYPHAANDHQTKNAQSLKNSNAAIMVKDEDLSKNLHSILMELYN